MKDYKLKSGERQISPTLSGIRQDHILRYQTAIDFLKSAGFDSRACGLDVFCGNGYGTYMMSSQLECPVLGIDGSKEAVELANVHYKTQNNTFQHKLFPFVLEEQFNFVVSLESVEHVDDNIGLLTQLCNATVKGGYLAISVPNKDVLSLELNPNKFHYRHYNLDDIENWCSRFGLSIQEIYGQDTYQLNNGKVARTLNDPSLMIPKVNYEGQFLIVILEKAHE